MVWRVSIAFLLAGFTGYAGSEPTPVTSPLGAAKLRRAWRFWQGHLHPNRLVYINETGVNIGDLFVADVQQ